MANRQFHLAWFLSQGYGPKTWRSDWLAGFTQALTRLGRAWFEQWCAIGVLAVATVLLNWITTAELFVRSIAAHKRAASILNLGRPSCSASCATESSPLMVA